MRSRDFKNAAREALSGNWFKAIVAALIAGAFGATGMTIDLTLSNNTVPEGDGVTAMLTSAGQGTDVQGILAGAGLALIVGLIFFAIQSAITVGYAKFNVNMVEGDKPRIIELFAHFKKVGTAMWANILAYIRIVIGSLLLFIPGIIASFQYSMVNYVIADNPEMTAKEALAESKRIMKGNKWKLFCLSLSFIGWAFVCALTLGLAAFYVVPLQQASFAAFYCEARDNA